MYEDFDKLDFAFEVFLMLHREFLLRLKVKLKYKIQDRDDLFNKLQNAQPGLLQNSLDTTNHDTGPNAFIFFLGTCHLTKQ